MLGSGESLIASSTFFAAEHLSALDTSNTIFSRSLTLIWPIWNLVTRMPVIIASLCFVAFLANFASSPYYARPKFNG